MSGPMRTGKSEGLTNYSQVTLMTMDGTLGLELCLDDVQRARRHAGDETASCAS